MEREKLQREGRLSMKEKERKKLELKINWLIESVRLHLDPLEEIEELDMEVAFQKMSELLKAWFEHREVVADIRRTKKVLGQD